VSPVVTDPILASGALKIQNNTRQYGTVPPVDGQALVYVAANNQWEPGNVAASSSGTAGRGDGGDFDTGTVSASFAFGIYGGGDLDTTTADDPIEFAGGSDGGEIT
jgi:hypothetical protein